MTTKEYILCALLVVAIYFVFHFWLTKQESDKSLNSIISDNKELTHRRTQDSIDIAEKNQAVLTSIKEAKEYYAKEMADLKAQGEYSNKELKSLKSYIKAEFIASTSGIRPTIIHNYYDSIRKDSVRSYTSTFKDNHFNVGVTILPDRSIWDPVEYSDTITVVGFHKKKFLFGKERTYVNAFMGNKNSKITGLTNFELKDVKDKRFTIGPAVIYDPFSNSVRVGVGLQYSLIRF